MTTNDKTLADAQPGGRVRLGDVLPQLPKMQRFTNLYGETYAYSSEQMRDYARAALATQPQCITDAYELGMRDAQHLSAQPSTGGQGSTFPWENFPAYLIDKCEGDTISEEGVQHALAAMAKDERYCLAARQPVGEP
jgi:hypothetical protein